VSFPVYVHLGPLSLHPHAVFEALAYFVGFRLYLRARRARGDVIDARHRWFIVAAAIAGGAIGSKLLFWLEDPVRTLSQVGDPAFVFGGKTVVGGLLGGLIAVELTKRLFGIVRRTGDLFAVPLGVGIAIGRVGCFLTGVSDATWGAATTLPWGIDGGDGILRHPSPLYEIAFLGLAVPLLARWSRRPHPEGAVFRRFMVGYLAFRLLFDALKPDPRIALGLSSVQWACVAGLMYYALRGSAGTGEARAGALEDG
jgi:prolipoprotein diacylglyceryltransferase